MKTCNKCGEDKALNQFYKNPGAKDGRANICVKCTNDARRIKERVNPEFFDPYYDNRQKGCMALEVNPKEPMKNHVEKNELWYRNEDLAYKYDLL